MRFSYRKYFPLKQTNPKNVIFIIGSNLKKKKDVEVKIKKNRIHNKKNLLYIGFDSKNGR